MVQQLHILSVSKDGYLKKHSTITIVVLAELSIRSDIFSFCSSSTHF